MNVHERIRVAALQMTSTPDFSHNLSQAHALVLEAKERGAEVVALPEYWTGLSPNLRQTLKEAQTLKGIAVQTLQEWALEYGLTILGGSLPLKTKTPNRITNTSLWINPDGRIAARYDKIHLYDATLSPTEVYKESRHTLAGKKTVTTKIVDTHVKVGLSVCYDLRFPELYRSLSQKGAHALFAPSAFTHTTGQAHWDVLTRARAIENQCYVIAPAQWGEHYKTKSASRKTYGHTRIVDPWGRIIAERPAGIGVVMAVIDTARLIEVRKTLPALKNRVL